MCVYVCVCMCVCVCVCVCGTGLYSQKLQTCTISGQMTCYLGGSGLYDFAYTGKNYMHTGWKDLSLDPS